jgi:carbamoyl-phosphate synthase small subunit
MKAKLVLENGTVFSGESFGSPGEVTGEVVFNTSLTGYEEIFTDPSYAGQIITMTYPLIGNYGVNQDDMESNRPCASGVIVKEYIGDFSNFRATVSLGSWLQSHGVVAIQGIDTRMLTRMLRTDGAMRGILTTDDVDDATLLAKVRASPPMLNLDLATRVTCEASYTWDELDMTPFALPALVMEPEDRKHHVVAYDYGIKRNIMKRLARYGCAVTVVPAGYPAEDVLALHPDGVFLSNGPGDPAAVTVAIENIRKLIGRTPVFGICLGHQLIGLALGGKTFKLKFGHRGGNHPVKNLMTGRIEITAQNHGFAVDPLSLDGNAIEVTHVNLNDGTNEGIRHRQLPLFSVQYHPEASPGPHDSDYLFHDFVSMMSSRAPVSFTAAGAP